jgi:hypothetical protein
MTTKAETTLAVERAATTPKQEPVELGKRVYLPGTRIRSACPKCSKPWTMDLGRDYVTQYPENGKPYEVHAYCEKCETEFVAGKVRYVLTVEAVT